MMIDLIERLGYPVLLVARRSLGTINHTLLSIEALHKRDIKVVGIILSRMSPESGPEEEFTPRDLSRLVEEIPVVEFPFLDEQVRKDPERIARAMAAIWPTDLLNRWVGA